MQFPYALSLGTKPFDKVTGSPHQQLLVSAAASLSPIIQLGQHGTK